MVKPEHQEAAERGFAAFTTRDAEAMVAVCHPEIEFMSLISEADGRVYRGHAGIREFFADQDEAFSSLTATLHEVESRGDCALTSGSITAEARSSGMTLDITFVQLAGLSPEGLILGWRF